LIWRDSISRIYRGWKLGNTIKLKIKNRCATKENLDDYGNINRWENITEWENVTGSGKMLQGVGKY
jgi:hypothetical protein